MTPPDGKSILERIAREERAMRGREFVAPVLPGSTVCIRVSGLVEKLRVKPRDHEGWAVLVANERGEAEVVRAATLSETSKYMARLPRYRMLLVEEERGRWCAVRAGGDARLAADALYPVGLVSEGERFDLAAVRFDGKSFWFEGLDGGGDPGRAEWLREQFRAGMRPEGLERPGLTPEERRVFAHLVAERERRDREVMGEPDENRRLRRAVEHAGGELLRFEPSGENLQVTFNLDGSARTVTVRRADLTVLTAGICLSGRERDFDLATLVSVLREADDNH